ncbi:sushi, von Willebrand factor type A, EGF and pentraxin domain-containing protein 1-like isoform X2 [Halichondria panicea]|uniref:sushi, von Willebrand factor type A, EGF and pentraxin domain-containing protein 1-like isoform X2 n=1 Tax=Halichondria panicea TaxID=6063 RepID=UPI00312BB834
MISLTQAILACVTLVVVTIVGAAVEICQESRCPGPLPQMQKIVAGDRKIEYFLNSSLVVNNPSWCINGFHVTDNAIFTMMQFHVDDNNILVYNPSPDDRANGLTLYAVDNDRDCTNNTNLITVQSNVGNISARLVLIHIVEVSCPALPHPVYGKVVHVTDRTANYSCNPGFNLNGNSTITCVTNTVEKVGEWIDSPPTCEPITCERPQITNGTVEFCGDGQEPNRTSFGAIATFHCDEGYILSDKTTLRCTYGISTENSSSENGNWSSTLPTCEPITCERPPITNGTVEFCGDGQEPNRTSFGAIATFHCDEGYILSDNTTLRCTYGISTENSSSENGNWSSTLPTCEALQPPTTSVTPVTKPIIIKITDPEGISIVLSAFIVGLVLGVLAASVVCYVCVKRTPTIYPITSCTVEGNLNRNDVLNGHNDYQMDGIEDSQKQDS